MKLGKGVNELSFMDSNSSQVTVEDNRGRLDAEDNFKSPQKTYLFYEKTSRSYSYSPSSCQFSFAKHPLLWSSPIFPISQMRYLLSSTGLGGCINSRYK